MKTSEPKPTNNVHSNRRKSRKEKLVTRVLGRTGRQVTTFGLGGQASLQWPQPDTDGEAIILKAIDKGVTYFDTSNIYDGSQTTYGKAFRRLHMVPGKLLTSPCGSATMKVPARR